MSSDRLREGVTIVAISAFVVWHSLAMLIAPLPDDNAVAQGLRRVFAPYLTLFNLNHKWDYFAPNVGKWPQLRYVVEDGNGRRHVFVPIDAFGWFHPSYRAMGYWYDAVMESPDTHGAYAGDFFCRKHASLKPKSVTFLQIEEDDYRPSHRLRGQLPRNPELVAIVPLTTVECHS